MARVILGAIVAAAAMFVIGFIFYASGLQNIASGTLDDAQAAAVQQALAANLGDTGTYVVPNPSSSAQTVMYGQGPIATIHYNLGGFAAVEGSALIGGLVLNFFVALLIGLALIGLDGRVPDFESRARLVAWLAVAASGYMHLKEPVFFHHDWGHFIYLFIADAVTLAAGGLIIARWFLPRGREAREAAAPGAG